MPRRVQVWRRANGWAEESLGEADPLGLKSVGVEVPVAEIYA